MVSALVRKRVPVRAVSRTERDWLDGVVGVVADPEEEHGLDAVAEGVDGSS